MNIIETKGLTRRFGGSEVVREVDFSLPAGAVCALLGPNGAGKSTLLRLLMNFIRPSAGEARIFGVDTRSLGPAEYAKIGHVAEAQALPGWMTVRELLDFCRRMYPKWDDALEKRLLKQFELPLNQHIRTFSRGMAVKASLVSSLAYRPRLIVLDEPFSSLDVLVREELVAGLLEVSDQEEWTLLVSSHDFTEVERLVDRVALMDRGTVWTQEDVESLQARFRRVEVSLPADRPDLPGTPETWLEYERSGGFIRFVDTAHGTPEAERVCEERYAGASVVRHPMSLREIFVALARLRRADSREARS